MQNKGYTLITGSSEGLGKAFAIECAKRGMNLILVALPGPELYALAALIKANYPVEVVCIGKDLCRDESCMELYAEVAALNLQVNMLINNAGIGSTILFEEGSPVLFEKQIRLNVLATTLITRLFLPMLQRHARSYILNVGSLASFFYLPKKQVYGATKSFIYFFSKSLREELSNSNVQVSVLCPGGINTNPTLTLMNKTGNCISRLSVMNPEEVVPIAINGLLSGKEVIIPGRLNNFFMLLDKMLPAFLKKLLTGSTMKKLDTNNQLSRYLAPSMVTLVVPSSKHNLN
ncbi:SDR family NAD(P)-dependent oxidoreductase [Terrimonas pollutisoli]|uniref:SDR family NAD(P)-dependent oxidoreductase n=1 Tax=Terrimonas pollutisoli TaxID=3034147 RepID=UPI0023EC497C|nr:SDR family NAD(P)-dependent oxidoreductase [Terrimonas sp. H1YJ31]